jgi:iron complex outermembrane receptor protein
VVQDVGSVKAEYTNDYEGGFRIQTSRSSAKINGFFMQFRNEISPTGAFIPEGFVQLRENISKSYRTGIEFQWEWRLLEPVTVSGNATWMQTNINSFSPGTSDQTFMDVESILSPEWLGNVTVRYQAFEWMDISLSGRYVGESFL